MNYKSVDYIPCIIYTGWVFILRHWNISRNTHHMKKMFNGESESAIKNRGSYF